MYVNRQFSTRTNNKPYKRLSNYNIQPQTPRPYGEYAKEATTISKHNTIPTMPQLPYRLPSLYTNVTTRGHTFTSFHEQRKTPINEGVHPTKDTRHKTYDTKQNRPRTTTKMSNPTRATNLHRLYQTFPQNETRNNTMYHPI